MHNILLGHKKAPRVLSIAVMAFVVLALLACAQIAAATVLPPHVAQQEDTDSCAICHRGHTSASGAQTRADALGTQANALLVGTAPKQNGDVLLCLACHGMDTLGSTLDVQSEFLSGPGHKVAPQSSKYGPSPKQCSDCHDSHGTSRTASGTPYPALLRTRDASTGLDVYAGDAYCGACHKVRAGNEFPGLAVWQQTAHATIAPPSSGTGIVCDSCHTSHASSIAPNIVSVIQTPALTATAAVPANDRRFCEACHPTASNTWDGSAVYATSAHGTSVATVPVTGEWASATASRTVGECQVCHDPMGVSNGVGGVIPKLAVKQGSALCYTCHDANGPASSNLASMAYAPVRVNSVAVAYEAPTTPQFGRVDVYSREATTTTALLGPRAYVRDGGVGAATAGDINGDGFDELLVARPGVAKLDILSNSQFSGFVQSPGDVALLATANYVAVGEVMGYPSGPPEIVTASGNTVRVYRWNTAALTLDPITAISVPGGAGQITGLAVGKVVDTSYSDIVVTTDADRLVVFTSSSFTLGLSGNYPTRHQPVGPSIGDIDADGHGEVAVANSGETDPILSVYTSTGSELWHGGTSTNTSATATAIGNFLPGVTVSGTSGDEIAVARANPTGSAAVDVFAVQGNSGVLDPPQTKALATRSNPSALVGGDVDGDGRTELVAALAGYFSADPALVSPPGVAIVHADAAGTGIGSVDAHSGGGAELAGTSTVAVGDFGAIGPSRHPVEAATTTHVSTETVPVAQHVACVDCHNTHAATAAVVSAPSLPGVLRGTWGVNVVNNSVGSITFTQKQGVAQEYQLCFKCHSSWGLLTGVRSIAPEFNTYNTSFHPVEAVSPSTNAVGQTMEGTLTVGSRILCDDCHGNSTTGQPAGPHSSADAPLLRAGYVGAQAADTTALCFTCHRYDIYGSGSAELLAGPRSGFYDQTLGIGLHSYHTARQVACEACHVSHGSATLPSLLRGDIGWTATANGGSCANACHSLPPNQTRTYARP